MIITGRCLRVGIVAAFTLLTATSFGCRSTERGEHSVVTESQKSDDSKQATLNFPDQKEEEQLFKLMLTTEEAHGVKSDLDQLHQIEGVIECRYKSIGDECQVRVSLGKDRFSAPQPIGRVNSLIWSQLLQKNASTLLPTKHLVADIQCKHLGKKSPPYNIEKTACEVRHTRLPNTIIFLDNSARELSLALLSDQSLAEAQVELYGSISCESMSFKGGPRKSCFVRPSKKGIVTDSIIEIKAPVAEGVAAKLDSTLRVLASQRDEFTAQNASSEESITGMLHCIVDNSRLV